jgi:hypothetical protein
MQYAGIAGLGFPQRFAGRRIDPEHRAHRAKQDRTVPQLDGLRRELCVEVARFETDDKQPATARHDVFALDLDEARRARVEDNGAVESIEDHDPAVIALVVDHKQWRARNLPEPVSRQSGEIGVRPHNGAGRRIDAVQPVRGADDEFALARNPLPAHRCVKVYDPGWCDLRCRGGKRR